MNAPSAATPAHIKPRAYKRFLTSAFHTRFVHAALLSLFICWDQAVLLAPNYDIFWSWFPLGPAGLRALLYFFAIIFIFILQVATVTVGKPTPTSPFQQVRQSLFSASTFKTCFWYIASAWWFTEVYIWSSSNMTWVTRGDMTMLDRLNERPIWFRAYFTMLGIVQAIKHVYFAQSTLQLPISEAPTPQAKDQRTHPISDTWVFLRSQSYGVALRCMISSVAVACGGPFVYTLLLRQPLWQAHLAIAKLFFNISRSGSRATGIPPIFGTMHTTIYAGFWLSMAWELSALSLVAYFKKPPVKNDIPWTSSGKDPNGSLLNGMKLKRGILKTFAFWELVVIAQNHPERRKAIFSDIDRPTGPVWSQMLAEGLKVIKQIDERIQPPPAANPANTEQNLATLPKILKAPRETTRIQEERNILSQKEKKDARARQRLLEIADDKIKQLGSHSEPLRLPNVPDTANFVGNAKGYFGWFFGSSNTSRINATVLGTPNSDSATIVDAIEGITRMLSASLQDDAYGKAMAGVPETVKQFTKTIVLIEGFLQQTPPDGNISDVELILRRLKSGLSELLSAFQMFLADTGLGIADLNAARKASGQLEAEKEEQKRLRTEAPRREPIEFDDAPEREAQPVESWREWNKPKSTTKLFPNYDPQPRTRRQISGGRAVNGHANGTLRSREMEQVR
ncbi:uncharacterized protein HMPREF1541_00435 [Cyphellophora europaea CBS 101466]|uniref:Nuclear envelope protein n=1 Tax=Cyphellophora europaea (strain CBS 101466) TaxID=1220924 RepID=W2SBZ4_CYPE1|nr:uncharacterized protein HMPREF1541_00435 [Cyphellophora europaea CBS 101466]ETN46251.1 hypothetical protein HMPREF1541_00435 [Cyphellophora europaea CBS 101466]